MVVLWQVLLASIASAASAPNVYDQRQTGKTNVRLELKDAVIIAVGDGELGGDYEYNYDYSDLTIKPVQSTSSTGPPMTPTVVPSKTTTVSGLSSKPATASVTTPPSVSSPGSFNITQNAAVVLEAENNSIIFPSQVRPGSGSTVPVKIPPPVASEPDKIPVVVLQEAHRPNKFLPVKTVEKQNKPLQTLSGVGINPKELPTRHCSPGFFLDNHNRCKRIQRPSRERPQLPIGLRFDHRPLIRN